MLIFRISEVVVGKVSLQVAERVAFGHATPTLTTGDEFLEPRRVFLLCQVLLEDVLRHHVVFFELAAI